MSIDSRILTPSAKGLLLVAALGSACGLDPANGLDPELGEIERAASPGYRAQVKRGTLVITGSNADSRLALRLAATPGFLEVDVGDDGSADFTFDRSHFTAISIDAGGGDDFIRMDESRGAFTHEEVIVIAGGPGNDTLIGGIGAETFHGGPGADTIRGGRGNDVVFMGDGDDTFVWEPGDGNDVIEGEGGSDTLFVRTSGANEIIELGASGSRLRFTRNVGIVTLDVDGVERVDVQPLGGVDSVVVNDLAGTAVARVNVDLATLGDTTGDGLADVVTVNGSVDADTFHVAADGAAVVVTGLAAEVRVTNGEPALDRLVVNGAAHDVVNVNGSEAADTMGVYFIDGQALVEVTGWNVLVQPIGMGKLAVNGRGGDDTIFAMGGNGFPLHLDGGEGNDTITGGVAADVIIGGPGDDTIDGAQGNDTIFMGDGADTYVWDPGDGSDVVEGGDGTDTIVFRTNAANEVIDLGASGGRLRLTRDVASIVLDADGIERINVHTLGGADSVVVNDLAGTSVARVNVDLSAVLGGATGDTLVDTVTVNGTPAADTITVAGEGGAVVVTGLAAEVRVTNGEPTLDRLVVNAAADDVVNVNGTDGPDTMGVYFSNGVASVILPDWSVRVEPIGMGKLAINGLGGDDTIFAMGGNGFPLHLDGGEGNDTITGGVAADVIIGGPGDDTIDGAQGNDTIFMGEGADIYVWDPGDGSDVVEGGGGIDTMVFRTNGASELIELAASGSWLRLSRNVASIVHHVDGIEIVDVRTFGGEDSVVVNDLAGTSVLQVNVILEGFLNTGTGDGVKDVITVNGSPAADTIAIAADAGSVIVTGLAAAVRILHAEPSLDQLVVNGLGGLDTITTGPGVEELIGLTINQD
jgi:Ca2+-binding RTX toxin-like protein